MAGADGLPRACQWTTRSARGDEGRRTDQGLTGTLFRTPLLGPRRSPLRRRGHFFCVPRHHNQYIPVLWFCILGSVTGSCRLPWRSSFGDGGIAPKVTSLIAAICAHCRWDRGKGRTPGMARLRICRKRVRLGHWALLPCATPALNSCGHSRITVVSATVCCPVQKQATAS